MVKFKLLALLPVDYLLHPVVSSLVLFALISCIRLLCDCSFRLCHHTIYICYFVALYPFLLWNCSYGIVLCCYQKRICFSLKASFYYSYYYFTLLKVFLSNVSRWFLTRVWVTASLYYYYHHHYFVRVFHSRCNRKFFVEVLVSSVFPTFWKRNELVFSPTAMCLFLLTYSSLG